METGKTLKIFFTGPNPKNYEAVKEKVKEYIEGNFQIFNVGDILSTRELMRFEPDIIITDYENQEIFINRNNVLKRIA